MNKVSETYSLHSWASRILLLTLLGLIAALVLLQANPLTNLPSRDGGIYTYIGSVIRAGGLPYVDAWESKPPGIFYLDAFALSLGGGTRWGIWLVEFVFLLIGAGLGYQVMSRIWNSSAALFGTLAWLFALNKVLEGGNYTEEYPLLFNFLALYVFWKGMNRPQNRLPDFVVGLAFALSFLFRPNNIGVEISIVLTWALILIYQKQYGLMLKRYLFMGLGALLPLVGTAAYFWVKGILPAMLDAAFIYNFSYTGTNFSLIYTVKPGFEDLGAPAWIALGGYLIAVVLLIRSIRTRHLNPVAVLLVIGFPVELLLSAVSGRGYIHYFMSWLPILALLCGLVFWQLTKLLFSPKFIGSMQKWNDQILAILFILLVLVFRDGVATYGRSVSRLLKPGDQGVEKYFPVAAYIRSITDPGETVLVWGGGTGLNYMADRRSPTPYTFYPLFINSPITQELVDGFYRDVTTHPPTLIVDGYIDAPDDVPSLDPTIRAAQRARNHGTTYHPAHIDAFFTFVQSNYVAVGDLDGYTIYRLRHS